MLMVVWLMTTMTNDDGGGGSHEMLGGSRSRKLPVQTHDTVPDYND